MSMQMIGFKTILHSYITSMKGRRHGAICHLDGIAVEDSGHLPSDSRRTFGLL